MAKIYAGTSGWAYAAWKPAFYPAKLPPAKFLGYYATRLNSVELNYTFRRFPTEKLQAGWSDATPENFKFAVKAHQTITHIKRLRGATDAAANFIASLQTLAEANKLGPILFQLPPFLKCDFPLLDEFLAALPRYVRTAFEFRHISWFTEGLFERLRAANVALCQAESGTLETPEVATADFSYLRLRKESYSVRDREAIAKRIAALAQQGDVFVYFKHEETPEGALYAESVLQRGPTASGAT